LTGTGESKVILITSYRIYLIATFCALSDSSTAFQEHYSRGCG
jgi:hypothetical protein